MNQLSKDDWQKLIAFHREVIRRGEETFFKLERDEEPSDRWSFIEEDLTSLAGPWEILKDDMDSDEFLYSIESDGSDSFFIAGPCTSRTNRRNGKITVEPLLYREVSIKSNGNSLLVNPIQDGWDLTPMFSYKLVNYQNINLDDKESLFKDILESAQKSINSKGYAASDAYLRALQRHIPETEQFKWHKYTTSSDTGSILSNWLLFSPGGWSPFNRSLVKDYDAMSTRIAETGELGGLNLITREASRIIEQVSAPEILPIVELNDSQKQAVESILADKQLSVISGPPGCGKSQVVVSTILNAWMMGKSVLFASNNNQAVDVVRQRLGSFEKDIPIAVRAGSKQHSNIEDSLRKIQSYLSGTPIPSSLSPEQQKQREVSLTERRQKIIEFINSNTPEEIEQSYESAIKAYAKWSQLNSTRKDLLTEHNERAATFNIHGEYTASEEALSEIDAWIAAGHAAEKMAIENQQTRERLTNSINTNSEEASLLLKQIQINVPDDFNIGLWKWLGDSPGLINVLASWKEETREFINTADPDLYQPDIWKDEYRFWKSAEDVESWKLNAEKLQTETKRTLAELVPLLQELSSAEAKKTEHYVKLESHGIKADLNVDGEDLHIWLQAYTREAAREKGSFDWLPWSEKSRNVKTLKLIERKLHGILPFEIWQKLGVISMENRNQLAIVINDSLRYLDTLKIWKEYDAGRKRLEESFTKLRVQAIDLRTENVPESHKPEDWESYLDYISQLSGMTSDALIGWKLKELQIEFSSRLRSQLMNLITLCSGNPLWEKWKDNAGRKFVEKLNTIAGTPFQIDDGYALLKSLPYDETLQNFQEILQALMVIWQNNESAKISLNSLPVPASFKLKWIAEAPNRVPVHLRTEFPSLNAELDTFRKDFNQFVQSHKNLEMVQLPELEASLKEEEIWSINKIREAISLIPTEENRLEVEEMLTDSNGTLLPIEQINFADIKKKLTSFSLKKLNRILAKIQKDLEQLSFSRAKHSWIERNRANPTIMNDLSRILSYLEKSQGALNASLQESFRNLLSAVPVWVTTAQSTQAIPLIPQLFDLVIIDEATQCTLTNLMPLIYRAKRLAVIGDPEQLPSISSLQYSTEVELAQRFSAAQYIEYYGHAKNDVYNTAVKFLPGLHSDVVQLAEHYRSHPQIIGFSNIHIYQSRLTLRKDPDSVKIKNYSGVYKVDVDGHAQRGQYGSSWKNEEEAEAVVELLQSLVEEEKGLSFGVVTPFKAQADYIKQLVEENGLPRSIVCGTAHTFQGDEKDVMIFSPVASPGIQDNSLEWIQKPRNLINVAVTRARDALFVVANFEYLQNLDGVLGDLIRFAESIHTLQRRSPEESILYSWMILRGWRPNVLPKIGNHQLSFEVEDSGLKIGILVTESEEISSPSFITEMEAEGYELLVFSKRTIRETPAVALRKLADTFKLDIDLESEDLLLF